MNKGLLKNQWILAGLILVISIFIGLLYSAVDSFFQLGIGSSFSAVALMISAMLVGIIYTSAFKEIIPNNLRKNVSIIYIIFQFAIGILYLWVAGILNLMSFGIFVVICILLGFLVYWMLGSGGKSCLKGLEKQKSKQEKL